MSSLKLYLASVKNADVGVKSIKGFVNRSFVSIPWFSVCDSYFNTRMKFLLAAHTKKDCDGTYSAFVEVKYGIAPKSGYTISSEQWKSIDRETWLKFFRVATRDGNDNMLKPLMTILPGGETPAFHCDLGFNRMPLRSMCCCAVANFLDCWRVEFPIFLLYGDRISSFQDLKEISSAMTSINSVCFSVKNNTYGNRREKAIEELGDLELKLEVFEEALSQVMEESADAMNILSDKYGIEIDIDEHCCSKPEVEV